MRRPLDLSSPADALIPGGSSALTTGQPPRLSSDRVTVSRYRAGSGQVVVAPARPPEMGWSSGEPSPGCAAVRVPVMMRSLWAEQSWQVT